MLWNYRNRIEPALNQESRIFASLVITGLELKMTGEMFGKTYSDFILLLQPSSFDMLHLMHVSHHSGKVPFGIQYL
jgi:hypothetical protein